MKQNTDFLHFAPSKYMPQGTLEDISKAPLRCLQAEPQTQSKDECSSGRDRRMRRYTVKQLSHSKLYPKQTAGSLGNMSKIIERNPRHKFSPLVTLQTCRFTRQLFHFFFLKNLLIPQENLFYRGSLFCSFLRTESGGLNFLFSSLLTLITFLLKILAIALSVFLLSQWHDSITNITKTKFSINEFFQ